MTFIWPFMLYTLLLVPLLVVAYLLLYNRRRARVSGLSGLGGQSTQRRSPGFRRHVPPLLFLLSLMILLVALARPQAQVSLPWVEGTVMLVFDVSASMGATDVEPSRLEAAKTAAREFVTSQPSTVKIGIVSFSTGGFAVQQPTNDTNALLSTIARLKPTLGTSLGQGIITALSTIAADVGLTKPDTPTPEASAGAAPAVAPTPQPGQQSAPGGPSFGPRPEDLLARLPDGPYPAAEIVLLTDGENNQSIDPVEAAKAALTHNVRVYALGFGTTAGTTLQLDGFSVHTALDEGTLQQVTDASGGAYYHGQGETDPKAVYAKLTPQLVIKPQVMEVTAIFAGAGIAVMLLASLLSMLWFNRLP